MWEFQCGRCPHFQKDREKHKDAWVGSLKAADFTMDMLISLVMLDEWTILFDPIWSIWGCRNLEALKSTCFPFLEDGHLRLGGLIHLSCAQYLIVPTSSTPAWSVPCPIAYIHIIRIPRSTTAAKTTPIKWGEAAGISSCGPSLREVGSWNMPQDGPKTGTTIYPSMTLTQKFGADFIKFHRCLVVFCFSKSPWGKMSARKWGDVRNARVIPQPGDGSCLYHSLSYGAGAKMTPMEIFGGAHWDHWEMVACQLVI